MIYVESLASLLQIHYRAQPVFIFQALTQEVIVSLLQKTVQYLAFDHYTPSNTHLIFYHGKTLPVQPLALELPIQKQLRPQFGTRGRQALRPDSLAAQEQIKCLSIIIYVFTLQVQQASFVSALFDSEPLCIYLLLLCICNSTDQQTVM